MRILDPIILPAAAIMTVLDPEIAGGGAIGPQVVGDQSIGNEAIFLQWLARQFPYDMLISSGLDQHIEHLAVGIDSAPPMDHAADDSQIDFVEMTSRVGPRSDGSRYPA
jgi:hypothetical protein